MGLLLAGFIYSYTILYKITRIVITYYAPAGRSARAARSAVGLVYTISSGGSRGTVLHLQSMALEALHLAPTVGRAPPVSAGSPLDGS